MIFYLYLYSVFNRCLYPNYQLYKNSLNQIEIIMLFINYSLFVKDPLIKADLLNFYQEDLKLKFLNYLNTLHIV